MRFRPEQRLRLQNEIRIVRERGARSDWRLFTLWAYRRPEATLSHPRAAVVASIAAIGPAVARNRAKRRLREVFRRHRDLVPADRDLLLVARTALKSSTFIELEDRFAAACARLRAQTP